MRNSVISFFQGLGHAATRLAFSGRLHAAVYMKHPLALNALGPRGLLRLLNTYALPEPLLERGGTRL